LLPSDDEEEEEHNNSMHVSWCDPLPLALAGDDSASPVCRVDLFPDGSAFVLENVLTPGECESLKQRGHELGYEDCGYNKNIRVTDRVIYPSQQVAKHLFERIAPFLGSAVDLTCPMTEWQTGLRKDLRPGRWVPYGLNDHFRLCRYMPGGFFLPHYDGAYDAADTKCSLMTFMLYLNDAFEGGATRSYNEQQSRYKEGLDENVTATYKPTTGSGPVFYHNITHDGQPVVSGEKYILRSEVMCRCLGR
jgi:hypothetical protein